MLEVPTISPPDQDVLCPLCGYNLRGLPEARCPECGGQFDWPDLLDPTRRVHRYLFEHHPERNIWSFIRTMIGGITPRRFWRDLHPAQPSRPKRLVLYWMVTLLLGSLSLLPGHAMRMLRTAQRLKLMRTMYIGYFNPPSATRLRPAW